MLRRKTVVVPLALSAILLAGNLAAQRTQVFAPHRPIAPRVAPSKMQPVLAAHARSMVGGLWMTDANFKSSIFLRNLVETSAVTVTPVLHLSNGTELALTTLTLAPSATAIVDINAGLRANGIASYATLHGYVEIRYNWPWDPVCVTVRNLDVTHSLIFTYGLQPSTPPASFPAAAQALDSQWWKQKNDISAFVALANTSATSVTATLQSTDNQGAPIASHAVTVSPHGTKLVQLAELDNAPSTSGGLHIAYKGVAGSLQAYGGIQDRNSGYSASITFAMRSAASSAPAEMSYAELGLMVGAADPMMKFPAGTIFSPYSVLRNVSDSPAAVTPTLWWMAGGTAHSYESKAIKLSPGQSQMLDVPALMSTAGLSNFSGSINLLMDINGKPGAVLLSAGSVDQTYTYVFEVTPRGILESASKSLSYWSTGNGDDTMVTIWNAADEAQDLVFRIVFSGGQYTLPVHLGARATRTLSLSQIIESQIPDADGNVIPLSIKEGGATLAGSHADNEHILVASDVGVFNVKKATCGEECYTCDGYTSASMSPSPFTVKTDQTVQMALTDVWNTGAEYNISGESTWSASGSNITVSSTGLVTGVAGGTAGVSASDPYEPAYVEWCGPDESDPCPIAFGIGGGASGTVYDATPTITSISSNPSPLVAGNTGQTVTIAGKAFGTNTPTLTFSDPTITAPTLISHTDTQIVANVTVPSSTQPESVTVDVTTTGYGGNSFNGGGDGQSATSGQSPSVPVVTPCPTGITYNAAGSFSFPTVAQVYPGDKSGAGLIAQMDVTGPLSSYNSVQIVEVLTAGTNSCQTYGLAACGTATTFTVGNANPANGSPIGGQPATTNAFWDNHLTLSTASILPAGKTCQAVCMQQYTCKGNNLGKQFTITRTFTASTYESVPVTNVSATKQ
jgi:hypothetical protein